MDQDPIEDPSAAGPGRRIGDFELLEELGRGGMGLVFIAKQVSLGRRVALKILPSFAGLDREAVARFRREAEATARLQHPGIVPVHAVGEADGLHWFAMEWIRGPNLEELIHTLRVRRPERLDKSLVVEAQMADAFPGLVRPPGNRSIANDYIRSCVQMAVALADALASAHDAGVIHRDLKPSNVLLHPAGRPVLVDFGLAQDLRADRLTKTGDTVGTPAYMAPEAVRGRRDADGRVDVYGLGALLHELLTMRPPFAGDTVGDLQQAILETQPEPVHRRNTKVPPVLAAVVKRCLVKDPDERYPSVDALSHELNAFLHGRPMLTRPLDRWDGLRHRLGRHRRLLRNAALVGAMSAAGVAGLISWTEAERERQGRELLVEAVRQAAELLDAESAAARLAEATVLLGEARAAEVAAARRAALKGAFQRFYGPNAVARLEDLFARVATPADRLHLAAECAQLAGQGSVVWLDDGSGRDARPDLWVLELTTGEGAPGWRSLSPGDVLPMGRHLICAGVPPGIHGGDPAVDVAAPLAEGAPQLRWLCAIHIGRDDVVELDPGWLPDHGAPGYTALFDRVHGRSIAMAVDEITLGQYRGWLEGLRPALQREMALPPERSAGPDAQPVVGLSFQQARAFAAHQDAMLPTTGELWLAATGGLRLAWPWGVGGPDLERLAADPDYLDAPLPIGIGQGSPSVTGVRHVLGNAAEIAVGPGLDRLAVSAGGHFQSVASALAMDDGQVPFQPLVGPGVPEPHTGVRLVATALGRASGAAAQLEAERNGFFAGSHQAILYRWEIQRDGSVQLIHVRSGTVGSVARGDRASGGRSAGNDWGVLGEGTVRLPLPLAGWVPADPGVPKVLDGHRNPCQAMWESGGRSLEVAPAQTLRVGQRQLFRTSLRLWPVSCLAGEGAGFTLRLPAGPLQANAAVRHEVLLPQGSLLDRVTPASARRHLVDGRVCLVFQTEAMPNRTSTSPVHIHFRHGGTLTGEWPTTTEARQAISAWVNPQGAVDQDPWLRPVATDPHEERLLERVLRPGLQRSGTDWLKDITAVGPVWTCAVDVPLELDGEVAADWPLVVRLARAGTEPGAPLQVVGAALRPDVDQGVVGADGIYRQDRLRLELRVPRGTVLEQLSRHALTQQVALRDPKTPGVHLQVLGLYAGSGETDRSVRLRLTGAATLLEDPVPLAGDEQPVSELTRRDGLRPVRQELWTFPSAVQPRAELHAFHRLGRRNVLLRAVAYGETAEEAVGLLGQRLDWLQLLAAEVWLP